MLTFNDQFKAARRVSTPIVAIRTFDSKSAIDCIRESLGESVAVTPLILWDSVNGFRPLNDAGKKELATVTNGSEPEVTAVCKMALQLASNCTSDAIVFMSNFHLQFATEDVLQAVWNLRDKFKSDGNMLVLMMSPGSVLPSEIANDTLVIDEPLPTSEQLQKIVSQTFKDAKLEEPSPEILQKATDALIGLPAFPADQTTAMCLDVKNGSLNLSALWERKRQVVSQTAGLSIYDGPETLETLGGLTQAVDYLKAVLTGRDAPTLLIFSDEIEKAFAGTGTDLSGTKTELTGDVLTWSQDKKVRGIQLLGIPGVGKSNLAKAIAGSTGKPLIMFDIAACQSSLVGSSGANIRAALKTLDALSGNAIGRILWIATCNDVSKLPGELKDRFKEAQFFFDAPTAEEKAAIWNIYRKQYGIPDTDETPTDNGWTGRDIVECCKKAYYLRLTLRESAMYVIPVTKSSAEQVRNLRLSCSGQYLSASKPGIYTYSEATETIPANIPMVVDGRKIREVN